MPIISHQYESLISTQTEAKKLIESIQNNTDIHKVQAGSQSSGYGRRGDVWFSPAGNFYASYVKKTEQGSMDAIVPLLGQSLCQAFLALGIPAQFESPNDILIDGHKVAGIIAEMEDTPGGYVAVVGIGINVEVAPFADRPTCCLQDYNPALTIEHVSQLTDKALTALFQQT